MTPKKRFRDVIPEIEREKILPLSQEILFDEKNPESVKALDYLMNERGFSKSVLKTFEVGYIPSWTKNKDGSSFSTHELAGRIITPVKDPFNNLIAFSSRNFLGGGNKFWHEKFDKSKALFGLNVSKDYMIKTKKAILVEGEFDVISLWDKGFKMTVGILGSAPQLIQLGFLKRYCDEVYVMFDGDESGEAAQKRIYDLCSKKRLDLLGLKLYPVKMPTPQQLGINDKKVDPDNLINKMGKEYVIELLKDSKDCEEIGL
jgi:DNA primase